MSKYQSEYCQQLIEHLASGYSIESFAGYIKVSKSTLYNWFNAHPEFAEARDLGIPQSQLWWETQLLQGLWEYPESAKLNKTLWIFAMKNRFGWRDVVNVSHDDNSKQNLDEEALKHFDAINTRP